MKYKTLFILLLNLLVIAPFTLALEQSCGITNLASCIPQKFIEYLSGLITSPLQPLLNLARDFMTEPVNIQIFKNIWQIIIYVISLFYSIMFLYAGFNFIVSGHDITKREHAKETLRNIVILMVLVGTSFFLYDIIIQINASLTAGLLNLAPENFFSLTTDNIINFGLQLLLGCLYLSAIFFTVLLLVIRYIIISAGVVILPIAIVFYYISPLQSFGKLLLNFLATSIFITTLNSIIILVCSKISELPTFDNLKILLMIACFTIINCFMFYFMLFSVLKSAMKTVIAVKTGFLGLAIMKMMSKKKSE